MKLYKYLIRGFTILIIIISIFFYIFFYSELFLPKGDLVETIVSPNKKYIAEVYIEESEELTIRVDILNLMSNSKKIIYWSWNEFEYGNGYNPKVEWLNDNYILINGRKINIKREKYDRRYMSLDKYR